MKKMLSVIAITAILASCGGGSGSENTDTTKVSADTGMAPMPDTTHMAPDTTHKDSVVH